MSKGGPAGRQGGRQPQDTRRKGWSQATRQRNSGWIGHRNRCTECIGSSTLVASDNTSHMGATATMGDKGGQDLGLVPHTGLPHKGTRAFQGKRCQPFTMIPLERWNVERRETLQVKRKRQMIHHPLSRCLLAGWNVDGSPRARGVERKVATEPRPLPDPGRRNLFRRWVQFYV